MWRSLMTHINRWHRWSWLGGEIWLERDVQTTVLSPVCDKARHVTDDSMEALVPRLAPTNTDEERMWACRLINERIELNADGREVPASARLVVVACSPRLVMAACRLYSRWSSSLAT